MSQKNRSYYGAFYWLALAAFVVPIFVGAKAFQAAPRPYTKPASNPDASGVDHALWDYLMKTYVANGLVDYEGMKRDHLFKTYLRQLGSARPEKLSSDADRLALLCNAYNAFVINGVITHGITDSVMKLKVDKTGFFDLKEHIFAGETISLDHLEHGMIRPTYNEPRVHVALVCAAKSCPPIRPEAYTGAQLERQLADQTRQFVNDPKHLRYEPDEQALYLSSILDWYGGDFDEAGGYGPFLAKYADDALEEALEKTTTGGVKVVFNVYDWRLNAQKSRAKAGAGAAAEFGSGSVPNE